MPRHTLIELEPPAEKAFLVAVDTGDDGGWTAEESLGELANLATTAGAEVVGAEWQNRRHVDPNWYVGKGKAEELLHAKSETGFTILIADDELSPDRQIIRTRIKKMKERVDHVRQQRLTAARGRDRRLFSTVSIVGYTNAGKS